MSYWRYGLIKENDYYHVEEIYYDKDFSKPNAWTDSNSVVGDSPKDVIKQLKMMIKDLKRNEGYFVKQPDCDNGLYFKKEEGNG